MLMINLVNYLTHRVYTVPEEEYMLESGIIFYSVFIPAVIALVIAIGILIQWFIKNRRKGR
jgi:hypothetical protein